MTTHVLTLTTGHTARITMHKHPDATLTFQATVIDCFGTSKILAYGYCPDARSGYRAGSSAVRSFVAMVANRRADGIYSIVND